MTRNWYCNEEREGRGGREGEGGRGRGGRKGRGVMNRYTETERLGQRKDKERQSRERERTCKYKINQYSYCTF